MKLFISSVIKGMESFRDAAATAARTLRHEVLRSEDFGARPDSPQQACFAGVRAAEVVIVLLGARYGAKQPSGLSATHEEYREARGRCEVLAFVQRDVEREPKQEAFVREVRDWAGGVYTADFSTIEDLRDAVTRGLHDLALRKATGPVDENELMERANALLPTARFGGFSSLTVVVVGGPCQQALRPAQLEDPKLHEKIQKEALFGATAILDRVQGTNVRVEGRALILEQRRASVLFDELGSVRMIRPVGLVEERAGMVLPALIEEDLQDEIERGLRFADWLLDEIDPPRRLSHVLPVVAIANARHLGWLTRAEYAARPNSVRISLTGSDRVVQTVPQALLRGVLAPKAREVAQDITVLFRREMQRL